ncbi:MAG: hypothetical protein JKY37_11890 [Nannocystaceae bacterium]|nr:hypothetical protein [Nannocystaceae bacterium]
MSHAAAIEALADRMRGFVRRQDCRLLHIVAPPELRRGVLQTVMAAEHGADNTASFVRFEQPYATQLPGWKLRSTNAREQHDARRDGAEPPIAELPTAPDASDALVAFAQQVWQLLEFRPPQTEGLVVVLAPKSVDGARTWAADVSRMVFGPSLSEVRFVVVDIGPATIDAVVLKLADAADTITLKVPENAAADALAQQLAGGGGAAPNNVTPPARPDVISGPMGDEAKRRVAIGEKVLAAALAMGTGDAVASVTAQREARDLCQAAGWREDAAQMELVLGGHLMAAGQPKAAESSFARALDSAREAELPNKVANAGFAVGAVRLATGQRHTALVAYAEAAVAAEQSGEPILAIEGNRLAGQAAADIKMEPQAITFFTRAVKLAEAAPPEVVSRTSAAQAARGLATICSKRRLHDRAAELTAQAERFETPVAPKEPEPEPAPEETIFEPIASLPPSKPADVETPSGPVSLMQLGAESDEGEPEEGRPADADPPSEDPSQSVPLFDPDLSIPPPDLLAPPLLVAGPPDLELSIIATPPPTLHIAPADGVGAATPEDFGEGTSLLTLDEISSLHWGDNAADSMDGVRPWTPDEIGVLQRAVNDALEPEATTMLSIEELAALRGEQRKVERPQPAAVARHEALADQEITGLEAVEPTEAVEPSEAVEPPDVTMPPPPSSEAFDPDEVTVFSLDEVAKMRKALQTDDDEQ